MSVVVRLSAFHNRKHFDCGNAELNRFIQENAGQYERKGLANVHILSSTENDPTIIGFFTLSAYCLPFDELPESVSRKMPQNMQLPFVLLGRLALDVGFKGQGLGFALLSKALRIANFSPIGSIGVIVDAKDEVAKQFYQRFGFTPFLDIPNRLVISKKEIERL